MFNGKKTYTIFGITFKSEWDNYENIGADRVYNLYGEYSNSESSTCITINRGYDSYTEVQSYIIQLKYIQNGRFVYGKYTSASGTGDSTEFVFTITDFAIKENESYPRRVSTITYNGKNYNLNTVPHCRNHGYGVSVLYMNGKTVCEICNSVVTFSLVPMYSNLPKRGAYSWSSGRDSSDYNASVDVYVLPNGNIALYDAQYDSWDGNPYYEQYSRWSILNPQSYNSGVWTYKYLHGGDNNRSTVDFDFSTTNSVKYSRRYSVKAGGSISTKNETVVLTLDNTESYGYRDVEKCDEIGTGNTLFTKTKGFSIIYYDQRWFYFVYSNSAYAIFVSYTGRYISVNYNSGALIYTTPSNDKFERYTVTRSFVVYSP